MDKIYKITIIGIDEIGNKSVLLESSTSIEIENLLESPEITAFVPELIWEYQGHNPHRDDCLTQLHYARCGSLVITNDMSFAEMNNPENIGIIERRWLRIIKGEEIGSYKKAESDGE